MATTPNVITLAEVDQAEFMARVADDCAAHAWELVEDATVDARILEERAHDAHERARRLRCQIGFRRASCHEEAWVRRSPRT